MAGQFQVTNPFHSQGLAAGGSALLDAINKGKVHLAKFILDAGECDIVNTRDFKGKTPLIRACYIKETKTREKAVNLLLSKGAHVNIQDNEGRTALSYACELRCNDVVQTLVQNNVDPDLPDNKGNTPLMYSSMVGNDTAIEILSKCFRRLGLNVDHVNDDGLTALLIAAKNGFIECASILSLEGRASVSFRDPEKGYTAEEWARLQGCSMEEVLPFSSTLALWQYRVAKKSAMAPVPGDLQLFGEMQNCDGQRSFVVERTTEMSTELVSIDEISRLLATSGIGPEASLGDEPGAMCMLKKRSSLPIIKFKPIPVQSKQTGSSSASGALGTNPKCLRFAANPGLMVSSFPEHQDAGDVDGGGGSVHLTSVGTQTDVGDPTRTRSADATRLPQIAGRARKASDGKRASSRIDAKSTGSLSSVSLRSQDSAKSTALSEVGAATPSRISSAGPQKIGLELRFTDDSDSCRSPSPGERDVK